MIVLAVLGFAAAGALGFAWYSSTSGVLVTRARRRVLVTLKSGEGFSGVLYEADRECLVLREATAVAYGPRSENVPVGGEVVLLRAEVAYLQVP